MNPPEIRAALDTSVVIRLLTGQPAELSTANLATAKPGFLDRLIHAEAATAHLPLVTFEKAAARLPGTRLLKAP